MSSLGGSSSTSGGNSSGLASVVSSGSATYCSYSHRPCRRSKVQGHNYCIRHILEDKSAPYKPCTYTSRAGKKCNRPYLRTEDTDNMCTDHYQREYQLKIKTAALANRPPPAGDPTPESLLQTLQQYSAASQARPAGASSAGGSGDATDKMASASRLLVTESFSESALSRVREWTSSDESDEEEVQIDQALRRNIDSDTESLDSEYEEPLKLAGVYTVEEAARISCEQLTRLQSLYKDQFRALQHKLTESHRVYLERRKAEHAIYGPINPKKLDKSEMEEYRKLKALKSYHNPGKAEAVVKLHQKEKRKAASQKRAGGHHYGGRGPGHHHYKCTHSDKKGKCGKKVLPESRYCQKHIMEDGQQVLFTRCLMKPKCRNVILSMPKAPTCHVHAPLNPAVEHYPLATGPVSADRSSDGEQILEV